MVTVLHPLKRGTIISDDDVVLRERDVGLITQGYMTAVELVVGQKLLRPMVTDQVLTLTHLEQAAVVRKGDQVVINARSGTLTVRMPGEALSDGGLSEQVRVKNLNSKRVIKARITGPGQVEVAL